MLAVEETLTPGATPVTYGVAFIDRNVLQKFHVISGSEQPVVWTGTITDKFIYWSDGTRWQRKGGLSMPIIIWISVGAVLLLALILYIILAFTL